MITAELNIRRFDFTKNPEVETVVITFEPNIAYNDLKEKVRNACKVTAAENKVIKLRNSEFMIIPYSMMLEGITSLNKYNVDVTNITHIHNEGIHWLQSAHINSVESKLKSMESRIAQAEMLLPQLEWKRHAHLEETVSHLSNKVAFLNRRFDEILPQPWHSKMPYTLA